MTSYHIDDTTFIYQTNCLYREHGQIIIARDLGNGQIQFNDISRGIYGLAETQFGPHALQNAYLHNQYTMDISYELDRELAQLAAENAHHVPCTR